MKMFKNDLNLEFTRGDTFSFGFKLKNLEQELEAAHFTCKQNFDDETPLFEKTLNDGIFLVENDLGDYSYGVRIAPEDTKDLELGKYYYDLQIQVNSDVFTILKGVLALEFDVTKGGEN